jgi:hypothetical protein
MELGQQPQQLTPQQKVVCIFNIQHNMARLWNKNFLIYLAGFVDGEGCIGVNRRKRNIWDTYDPYLSITNTDLSVLEYIKKNTMVGSIRENMSIRPGRFGRKRVYGYWLSNRNARMVIKAIYPYLIVKKEQAKLVIDMPKRGGSFNLETEKYRKNKQIETYLKLKELHGRSK